MLPVLPKQVLDVDLASIGLELLAREGSVQNKLALELLGVLVPFVLVEEVLVGATAAVEQRYPSPVVEGVRSVLLNRTTSEGNTFLNKSTERSNTLKEEKKSVSDKIEKRDKTTNSSGTNHDDRALGVGGETESRPPHMNWGLVGRALLVRTARALNEVGGDLDFLAVLAILGT